MKRIILTIALVCTLPASAMAMNRAEQQNHIRAMSAETLDELYRAERGAEQEIKKSYGYAVFTNANLTAFFLTAAVGNGVAHDEHTNVDTFMQMASGGVGIGLGAKDFRVIFVFANKHAYDSFISEGIDLSTQADIAAKAGTQGAAGSGGADVRPGVRVYQLTENGLVLQLTLQGTRYWKDDNLNSTGPEIAEHHTYGGGAND